jgi:hypothetical protein
VAGAALVYQHDRKIVPRAVLNPRPVATANLTTRPVVETYESEKATIVEVPTADTGSAQVVMIFDDALPSDL